MIGAAVIGAALTTAVRSPPRAGSGRASPPRGSCGCCCSGGGGERSAARPRERLEGPIGGLSAGPNDTGGKLVDRIAEYVIRQNPKNGRPGHGPSQQGWGEVKTVFGAFVKRVRSLGKSVIFVCHESEEKNGDETIKRPDMAGSSRKDVASWPRICPAICRNAAEFPCPMSETAL